MEKKRASKTNSFLLYITLSYCIRVGHVLIENKNEERKNKMRKRYMNREIGVQFDYELVYAI